MLNRIKNLIELSKYRVEDKNLAGDPKARPTLVPDTKPKGMATIVEDDPIEQFPNEAEHDSTS